MTSPQASKYEPIETGVVIAPLTQPLPKEPKVQEKHGIQTPVGVSLYDKGKMTIDEAQENVLAPVKVLILPPENLKKGEITSVPGTPESVVPLDVRIFPITNPKKEIEQEIKQQPLTVKISHSLPPEIEKRPQDPAKWTQWVLNQLEKCDGNLYEALPTLYWMMNNNGLTDGKKECDMKEAVAAYMRKCHPWPAVYYTPTNAAAPKRPLVQMASELMETVFTEKACYNIDLSRVNFEKVEFYKGSLESYNLSKSYFKDSVFIDVNMREASFEDALIENALFQGGDLSKAYFKGAKIKNSHLLDIMANMANFEGTDMVNTQIRSANLSFADFSKANLPNTMWENIRAYEVNAVEANFTKAVFKNLLFEGASLNEADFSETVCFNCVFQNAKLNDAQFYHAELENVSFKEADLSKADFSGAILKKGISVAGASLYGTNFSSVDLTALPDVGPEVWRLTVINEETVMSGNVPDFQDASYDIALFNTWKDKIGTEADTEEEIVDKWSCTPKMCQDRLLGRASNRNITLRAMSLLDSPKSSMDEKVWSLCTMGCVARHDRKLEPSQIDLIAEYIRQNVPWSLEDLFKPFKPIPVDVQMALYILTDPDYPRDLGYTIDLTSLDLRGADLSKGDLRNINFAGSNLSGATLEDSRVDNTFKSFDKVIIDQFTHMPKKMGKFLPYDLPDSIWPKWWKPEKIRVIKDNINLWTIIIEQIPFSDEYIVRPIKEQAEEKEK